MIHDHLVIGSALTVKAAMSVDLASMLVTDEPVACE